MRFSSLSLERYGRFDGCQLDFRAGSPDLHIIYGANEAGKTTSLAAVSDLLFGFPQRSPYNFLFDYSLLRVGALIEDGADSLACRRKKGGSGTLLDADDRAIDEAPLLAMLKGQTRETFGLSFSLDQDALRAGGRAMVDARNDLGRALFAAGSGLTGVADILKRLNEETDEIWAPTAASRRHFTFTQKQLGEHLKVVRDAALKPKTWADARATQARAAEAVAAARAGRDAVQAELAAAQRTRRLAPLVRHRADQRAELEAGAAVVDLGRAREDSAEAAIDQAAAAERSHAAAQQMLADVAARKSKVAADPAVLAEADAIDFLVTGAGAGEKAVQDVIRLEGEYRAAAAMIEALRTEAGVNADASPTRAAAARLRELAQEQAQALAVRGEIDESRADLAERRARAAAKLEGEAMAAPSDALAEAVDAARALGADVDARCGSAQSAADRAAAAIGPALEQLSPWTGDVAVLRRLQRIGADELGSARDALARCAGDVRAAEEDARRAGEEAAKAALAIAQLATAAAVSPEEIAAAQAERAARWAPLRDHVLGGAAPPSPPRPLPPSRPASTRSTSGWSGASRSPMPRAVYQCASRTGPAICSKKRRPGTGPWRPANVTVTPWSGGPVA